MANPSSHQNRRSIVRAIASVLSVALAATCFLLPTGSCNTPFIPLPPPGDPSFTAVAAPDALDPNRMAWRAQGGPNSQMSNARIFVWNASIKGGIITQANPDGSYTTPLFDGSKGDRVELRYEGVTGEKSEGICRILESGIARTTCPR